jgi:hypothetical protein
MQERADKAVTHYRKSAIAAVVNRSQKTPEKGPKKRHLNSFKNTLESVSHTYALW